MKYLIAKNRSGALTWVAELDGNSMNLVGLADLVEEYSDYFANPDGGWKFHLEEEDPLLSFAYRSSYADFEATDDEKAFAQAKESLLSDNGVEKTITWQTKS